MKIRNTKIIFWVLLAGMLMLPIAPLSGIAAEINGSSVTPARLKWFDFEDTANQETLLEDEAATIPSEQILPVTTTTEVMPTLKPVISDKYFSVTEKQWDMSLAPDKERNIFVLWPYRPSYILPLAYNASPNRANFLDFDPDARSNYNEVKFQISFKFKIWEDLLRGSLKDTIESNTGIRGIDLWFAYTQLSFWQLYNSAFSSPFRDTNYEPEMLCNVRLQHEIPGLGGTKLQFINFGFNHQSNGRAEPLSRSWNRIVANIGLEKIFGSEKKDSFSLLLKTWYRIPEDEADDDNPDITDYLGYGELWGTLYWKQQRFALMIRNNLKSDNKGAVQLDWSFPLPLIGDKVSGYIQYFNGYGECLLDYKSSSNRISAGFMLTDWH